MQEHEKVRINY